MRYPIMPGDELLTVAEIATLFKLETRRAGPGVRPAGPSTESQSFWDGE